MRCPACEATLGEEQVDGVPVYRCEACSGEYVEREVLVKLLASHAGPPDAHGAGYVRPSPLADPVRYLRCPVCGETMLRRNFHESSGVIVDVCAAHGVWFDRDELPKILEFASTGALAEADRRTAGRAEAQRWIDAFDARLEAVMMRTRYFPGLGW
jgi:Zn-finger nucleic acid-binding protein